MHTSSMIVAHWVERGTALVAVLEPPTPSGCGRGFPRLEVRQLGASRWTWVLVDAEGLVHLAGRDFTFEKAAQEAAISAALDALGPTYLLALRTLELAG